MNWDVRFHDEFETEFESFAEDVQANLLAAAKAVQIAGPKAGRPHVDTLDGSKHSNMKECALPCTVAAKSGARHLRLIRTEWRSCW